MKQDTPHRRSLRATHYVAHNASTTWCGIDMKKVTRRHLGFTYFKQYTTCGHCANLLSKIVAEVLEKSL